MNTISLCQTCKKPTGKKPNAKYCDDCNRVFQQRGAYRYKITDGVYVWVKGRIMRAVVNGENVVPVFELREVVD